MWLGFSLAKEITAEYFDNNVYVTNVKLFYKCRSIQNTVFGPPKMPKKLNGMNYIAHIRIKKIRNTKCNVISSRHLSLKNIDPIYLDASLWIKMLLPVTKGESRVTKCNIWASRNWSYLMLLVHMYNTEEKNKKLLNWKLLVCLIRGALF